MKKMINLILLTLGLLPAFGCGPTAVDGDAAFDYREIYLPESNSREARALGLNNLDDDWGIWGHNLSVVLPGKPSLSVFATVDGHANDEQFCFSSDQLYRYIERYIVDNFGEKRTTRFSIMPQDNGIACLCEQCQAKGCSGNDASPAVFSMIERLAARFPNHLFFTSYYQTTRSLPQHPMPENAGVLFSAIDYHLSAASTAREEVAVNLLKQWAGMTQHIYVWDYIDNFDDYFTPFPVFTVMQRRFRLYREAGVNGVFLNGSGTDFSTFSRIRLHVLAALMRDPETDWRRLLEDYCQKTYPATGAAIARFMLGQEDLVAQNGKVLPLYEGVARSRKVYLDESAFTAFFDELRGLLPQASGDEREDVTTLCQALTLTRLELMRLNGKPEGCQPLLEQLSQLPDRGVRTYSESFWTIDDYVSEYTAMWRDYQAHGKKSLLRGKELTALTGLDEDYTDLRILTDGLAGLPSNYHCGHLISSADPHLRLAIPHQSGIRHLRVGLTSNRQFHIGLPKTVSLSCGSQQIGSVQPQAQTGLPERVVVEFDVPASAGGTLVLTLVRNPEERTMALDEVEAF